MKSFKDFIMIISNVPEKIYIDIMYYLLYICHFEKLIFEYRREMIICIGEEPGFCRKMKFSDNPQIGFSPVF